MTTGHANAMLRQAPGVYHAMLFLCKAVYLCLSCRHSDMGIVISRAEQQAERSRMLADEDVDRIRGQLTSLGSLGSGHHADASAQPLSSSPKAAARHPGIDRHAFASSRQDGSHARLCLIC